MITYETDELKRSNRKNINTVSRKGRTAKIYTMNIEKKQLLKQSREKTLQNAKGKRLAEEYFLTTLKASRKIHRALKNTQKRKKSDNGSINDENMNIAMIADNINNLKIVANNEVNATTNAEDKDIEPTDIDNVNTAETEIDKSEDIVMSDNNDAGADPGFDQAGAQIVTSLKLPFWGLSFVEFWCWGLIFSGQGGLGPWGPPGSTPVMITLQ